MGKLILWLFWAILPLTALAQNNKEIIIATDREYTYPDLILFAYSSKHQLILEVLNSRLIIKNPHGVHNAPLQIITLDGKVHNFMVMSFSPERQRLRRKELEGRRRNMNKVTRITFMKRYSESRIKDTGSFRTGNIFDQTSLILNSIINKNTSFLAQLGHTKSTFVNNEFQQLSYFLRLNYFNTFAEYGMMNMRKFVIRDIGGTGGRVVGTRLGYKDQNWSVETFKGKNFFGTSSQTKFPEFDLQGASVFYNYRNTQELGVSFYENTVTNQNVMSVETKNNLNKVKFTGNYSLHHNQEFGQSGHYTWNAEYNTFKKSNFSLRSLSLGNTVYSSGFNSLTYGDYNRLSQELWHAAGIFNLLTDSSQSLLFSSSFSRGVTDVNEINDYGIGLDYSYQNLSARLYYNTLISESSLINSEPTTFTMISPSLNLILSPTGANRTQSIGLSARFSENDLQDYKNNTFNLSYRNSSPGDQHNLNLSRQTSESSIRISNQYGLSYGYSKIYDNLRFGPSIFYTFSNFRADDPNIYLSDSYGYRFSANYNLRPHHSFGANFGESTSMRRDPYVRIQTYSLSYSFNYGADIQTPVAKLFNHRSFKAHFFKDTNFNGKLDNGEKLKPNLKVSILDDLGEVVETKKTDKDGFVSFSWLTKGQFQLQVEGEDFYSSSDKWIDLERSSVTKEIALAEAKSVVVKIFDTTTQKFISGSISFDIKCASINYSRSVRLDQVLSLTIGVPRTECTVAPNFLYYGENFEGVDIAPKLIDKREIVFNIRHKNELEFIFNLKDKDGKFSPYTGKGLKVRLNGKVYVPEGDFLTVELAAGEHRYDLRHIVEGPFVCKDPQNNEEYITYDQFFLKKQIQLFCEKR